MSDKPFYTYAQLIAKLRDEKKLSIPDDSHAVSLLKKHGYFALVSGYKSLFKAPDGCYLQGTTIDDIFALYEFDNRLRDVLFYAILAIEKNIKSLLSYVFTEKYGDNQREYCKPENYDFVRRNPAATYNRAVEVNKLIKMLYAVSHPPFDHKYIEHQWNKHDNVPLWAALKAVTLGSVSKMYSLCPPDVRTAVSKEFAGINEGQLVGMLDILTRVRNVCAHNERLYDFEIIKGRALQNMSIHKALGIKYAGDGYVLGRKDLFAAIVCFKYLLENDTLTSTIDDISNALNKLSRSTGLIPPNKILCRMGFPNNWSDIKVLAV